MQQFFDEIRRRLPAGLGISENTIHETITITGHGAEMVSLETPPEAQMAIKLLRLLGHRIDDQEPVTPGWLLDLGCEDLGSQGIGEGLFEWQFKDASGADSWIQFDPARGVAEIHSNVIVAIKTRGDVRALQDLLIRERVPCSSE